MDIRCHSRERPNARVDGKEQLSLRQQRQALKRRARAATADLMHLRARWGATCSACFGRDLHTMASCRHRATPLARALRLPSNSLTPPLAGVYAAAAYRPSDDLNHDHPLSVLIRLEKNRIDEMSLRLLGGLLSDYVAHHTPLPDLVDAIVPVPTSREHKARRGGSIPLMLASSVRDLQAIPLCETIVQVGRHVDHREAQGAVRKEGLRQAWRVRPDGLLAGRAVMLIDDIVTTGTTLSTAAELLLEAGVGTVYGVALLHTERTSLGRSTQPPAHSRHQPQGRWKAQHGSIASAARLPGTGAAVPDADLESERRCEA